MNPLISVDALFNDPRFREHLGQFVKEKVTCLAIPQLRGICNHLFKLVEETYTPSISRGYIQTPSPLQIMLIVWPETRDWLNGFVQRFPDLGASPDASLANCRQLRCDSNQGRHVEAPEDLLQQLRLLRNDISLPALREGDPFLHGTLASSEEFVAAFLAGPRVVKLAQVALQYCKDPLSYSPERSWPWEKPDKPDKARRFIDTLLHAVPALAKDVADFVASADALSEKAHQFGPTELFYPPSELQRRVALCLQLGLFSKSVQESYPFAYGIVTHLDSILSIDV